MSKSLKNKAFIGSLLIGIASILWGLDGVVLTPQLNGHNIVFVVFLLHAIPFLLMNFFMYSRYKEIKLLNTRDKISLLLVSVLGGALGTIAIVKALFLVEFQPLSVVVLLQKFQPIFAIILAAIVLKEKLTKNFIIWVLLAVVAGYFLTFGLSIPSFSSDSTTINAMLLSLFAAFSFGSSTVFSKNILAKVDYLTATFFRYGLTFLLLLPFIIVMGLYADFKTLTTNNWIIILTIALTTGSGAILLYYYGLKYIKASASTLIELFFPISAILFDYFINGNVLSIIQWFSAAIMIFAIIKANSKNKEQKA